MDRGARDLQPGDVDHLAKTLRASDVLTLLTLYPRMTIKQILEMSVKCSTMLQVFVHQDEPIAMYGAAPITLLSSTASPWLLASDLAFKYPLALVREGRRYSRRMLEVYPHLENYVDARDERAVRWIRRIGYTVHDPEPFGEAGALFHRFEMRA